MGLTIFLIKNKIIITLPRESKRRALLRGVGGHNNNSILFPHDMGADVFFFHSRGRKGVPRGARNRDFGNNNNFIFISA